MFGGVDVRRGEIHSKKAQTIYMEGGGWGGVINQMEEGERVGVDDNTEWRVANDNVGVVAEVDIIIRVVAVDVASAVVVVKVDLLNNKGRFF